MKLLKNVYGTYTYTPAPNAAGLTVAGHAASFTAKSCFRQNTHAKTKLKANRNAAAASKSR